MASLVADTATHSSVGTATPANWLTTHRLASWSYRKSAGTTAPNGRLATALATLRTPQWPYAGPVGILERDATRDATELHAVDRWCYLGAARCEPDVAELLELRPAFDYDEYRILSRYLAKPGARVVPLNACTASS